MAAPWFLSAPFDWIVAPLLPAAPWLLLASCLLGAAVDLASSTPETPRGRLASLCLALLLIVIGRGWFAFDSWASTALVIAAYGVLVAHGARFGWPAAPVAAADNRSWWLGLAIVGASFALKCVALDGWPSNLNTYSAMTGEEGLKALAGKWPSPFFAIRAYPLADGGQSPLHLPILLASLKAFGGTVFAVRFAEVVGSTILLVVFWAWVRTVLPRGWALATLTVFAFSPWHLAQARFGSFYSLCAALALALLWFGEHTRDGRAWTAWLGLGLCAAAISWAYAPLQVLYVFFIAVVAAGFGYAGKRWQPLIAVGIFAVIVGFQLAQGGRDALMRSDFGQLATDTVIWRKNAEHATTTVTQPLVVVADNFARNIKWWFEESFKEPDILIWWAPALGLGFLYALSDLWRADGWMRSLYYLLGMLPPLLIFPLHRRTLIVWPLVYVAGIRFCRDLVAAAKACRGQPWTGRVATLAVGIAIVLASLHGLRIYAIGNPAGLVYPYFGPPDQYLMIAEAKQLLPRYHLLFVNPGVIEHVITIGLYEPARATQQANPYELVTLRRPEDGLANRLRPGRPNCFVYLNDEQHTWVTPTLLEELPGGKLIERRTAEGAPPVYSLYFFPGE